MTNPNIVVVVMDTATYEAYTTICNRPESTLDVMASNGVEYTNAFANAPWSLPSHASIFTGTYTSKHGAHAGHPRLGDELVTLAEAFRVAGYETVAISNNTWISEEFGFGRGFDRFHKTWQYVQTDVDLGRIARTEEGLSKFTALGRKFFDGNPVVNAANAVYGQFFRRQHDDGADRTNEWIKSWLDERTVDDPFFMFVNYLEPHIEYQPPEEFAEPYLPADVTYEEALDVPQDAFGYIAGTVELSERDFDTLRGLYLGELAYLDSKIGELRTALEIHSGHSDTVLVVTADHGENIGDHGLMDHQYCLYDTLLHVPLVIEGGAFTDGKTIVDLVQLTDLAPTLLDEVGIEATQFRLQLQGQSVHPESDVTTRSRVIAEYLEPQPSMEALVKRVGVLPEQIYRYDRSLRAIRTDDWKLIRGSDGSVELYDIVTDPIESKNVSANHPDTVKQLNEELDKWLDSFDHAVASEDIEMDEATKKRLENLGYLQ